MTEFSNEKKGAEQPASHLPPRKGKKGSRVLICILVAICAAFTIGFGGYGIFLSVQQSLGSDTTSSDTSSEAASATESAASENPVGSNTNPNYAGMTLEEPSTQVLSPQEIYQAVSPSVVQLAFYSEYGLSSGYGSAVVLTQDGYLLTTARTVGYSRTGRIDALTADGQTLSATVVGLDSDSNLAVLKVSGTNLVPARFASGASLTVGETVYGICGSPQDSYNAILSEGILSAKDRLLSYDSVNGNACLQTSLLVGGSADGGVVVNRGGQVVGLLLGDLSAQVDNGCYAIPMQSVPNIVSALVKTGYAENKVRLGISGTVVTEADAASYQVPRGVMIAGFSQSSAFAGTEAKEGDIITEMDGTTIQSMSDVTAVLDRHKAGDVVSVTLYRVGETGNNDTTLTVSITLLADQGETQKAS